MVAGSDLVFIAAGLGGGTGSGAAPVIAAQARKIGALTVGVVTRPFVFEGVGRRKIADAAEAELRANVDTLLLIENERVLSIVGEDTSMLDAFTAVNEVLAGIVRAVVDIMTVPGLINLDFADVRAIMQDGGTATAGIGAAVGPERAVAAANAAVANPLLNHDLAGAGAILLNVAGASGMTMREVTRAAEVIRSAADPEAMIIFGTIFDDHLDDELRVTVIATRLRDEFAYVSRVASETRSIAETEEPAPARRRLRGGRGHRCGGRSRSARSRSARSRSARGRGRGGGASLGGDPDRDVRGRARRRRGIRGNRGCEPRIRSRAIRTMGGEPGVHDVRRAGPGRGVSARGAVLDRPSRGSRGRRVRGARGAVLVRAGPGARGLASRALGCGCLSTIRAGRSCSGRTCGAVLVPPPRSRDERGRTAVRPPTKPRSRSPSPGRPPLRSPRRYLRSPNRTRPSRSSSRLKSRRPASRPYPPSPTRPSARGVGRPLAALAATTFAQSEPDQTVSELESAEQPRARSRRAGVVRPGRRITGTRSRRALVVRPVGRCSPQPAEQPGSPPPTKHRSPRPPNRLGLPRHRNTGTRGPSRSGPPSPRSPRSPNLGRRRCSPQLSPRLPRPSRRQSMRRLSPRLPRPSRRQSMRRRSPTVAGRREPAAVYEAPEPEVAAPEPAAVYEAPEPEVAAPEPAAVYEAPEPEVAAPEPAAVYEAPEPEVAAPEPAAAAQPALAVEPPLQAEPPWYDPGDEGLEAARSAAAPAFTAPEGSEPTAPESAPHTASAPAPPSKVAVSGKAAPRAPEPPPSQLARRTTQAVLTGVWKRLQKPQDPRR